MNRLSSLYQPQNHVPALYLRYTTSAIFPPPIIHYQYTLQVLITIPKTDLTTSQHIPQTHPSAHHHPPPPPPPPPPPEKPPPPLADEEVAAEAREVLSAAAIKTGMAEIEAPVQPAPEYQVGW